MNEVMIWKLSDQTQRILKENRAEQERVKEELLEGGLLLSETSDKLAREYSHSIGEIKGLKF
jgi:hypothetical protein